jgi:hypothetical protein
MNENPELNDELMDIGRRIEALPHPQPPHGLVARTLACIEQTVHVRIVQPVKKVWWLRPITHPIARLVAALLLISTLAMLADIDRAERVGQFMSRLMGARATERLEVFVDRVLLSFGPVSDVDKDVVRQPERPRAQPGAEEAGTQSTLTDWV